MCFDESEQLRRYVYLPHQIKHRNWSWPFSNGHSIICMPLLRYNIWWKHVWHFWNQIYVARAWVHVHMLYNQIYMSNVQIKNLSIPQLQGCLVVNNTWSNTIKQINYCCCHNNAQNFLAYNIFLAILNNHVIVKLCNCIQFQIVRCNGFMSNTYR